MSCFCRPQTAIAAAAGLRLNGKGGIVVDTAMRTSDSDIFAVGDAAEIKDFLSGAQTMVLLAGPANRQGRIAAANVLGAEEVYGGTQGTSIVKIFDLTAASTGINEKGLKAEGKKYGEDYLYTMTHPKSHAGYYPDALTMDMKMIFDPSTRKVLGAQIIGFEGVDKRIDVLATVIRMGGTIDDLTELELAYAPPYSAAKDPVNMAGYIAENMLGGLVDIINWNQLGEYPGAVLLDVRGQDEEDEVGLIPGSVLLPLPELRFRLDELDREKTYIVYCAAGLRGYIAARMMSQNGFSKVKNLAGGFTTWQPANWKREESSGA